ncbi:MAG: phosphoenolpyruvate--protein phosphotransferase [Lawsonibacter sp.]|jgi:phosphotransferase system enzyme I (PtsI)
MHTIYGTAVSPGVTVGRIWVKPERDQVQMETEGVERAREHLRAALVTAKAELEELYRRELPQTGTEGALIFEVQRMMLEDEDYLAALWGHLAQQEDGAERAVQDTEEEFSALFTQSEEPYLQARALDVKDISRRLLRVLRGGRPVGYEGQEGVIVAAEELLPSEVVTLDGASVVGLLSRRGSYHSHAAILARMRGIPMLIGVEPEADWAGRLAVLDGNRACVYLDPTQEVLGRIQKQARQEQDGPARPDTTTQTARCHGEEKVYANVGSAAEALEAAALGVSGIGLFRSEFLCIGAGEEPSEEEHFSQYKAAAEAMAGRPVVIRTLDLGGEKRLDGGTGGEENPALGCRGIRYSLSHPEGFRRQLRAILRAAAFGKVAVLFPMITSVWEVRQAKQQLSECRAELLEQGIAVGAVEVGVMMETPAAVLLADELAQEVDFFSIGSNDLTQYTLAVDRQASELERYFDPHHPAVLRLIALAVEAGHRHGCRVAICGELGADLTQTEFFLQLGVDEISVALGAVLPLRQNIQSLTQGGLQMQAGERDQGTSAAAVSPERLGV